MKYLIYHSDFYYPYDEVPRYIPTWQNLQAIEATFGKLVAGYMHDWKNRYFDLCGERVPEMIANEE